MVRFPGYQACWFAQVEAPEANDASETAKVQPRKHVMVSYAWKKIDGKGAPALLAVAAADGTHAVAQAACVRARAACGRLERRTLRLVLPVQGRVLCARGAVCVVRILASVAPAGRLR